MIQNRFLLCSCEESDETLHLELPLAFLQKSRKPDEIVLGRIDQTARGFFLGDRVRNLWPEQRHEG